MTINGTNFVRGADLTITNYNDGTTSDAQYVSDTQVYTNLSRTLPPGDHTITITNPDGQAATATLTTYAPPQITSVQYHVNVSGDGTSYVTVNGEGFVPGCSLSVGNAPDGTTLDPVLQGSGPTRTQIIGNLNNLLPGGDHKITVVNPDGLTTIATLVTLDAPVIFTPPTAVTDKNGKVHLVVSGDNFGTPGYNDDAEGGVVVVAIRTDVPSTSLTTVAPPNPPTTQL